MPGSDGGRPREKRKNPSSSHAHGLLCDKATPHLPFSLFPPLSQEPPDDRWVLKLPQDDKFMKTFVKVTAAQAKILDKMEAKLEADFTNKPPS